MLDLEPLAARIGDHVRVEVDAARLDAGLAQQHEELPASATEVEHRGRLSEVI